MSEKFEGSVPPQEHEKGLSFESLKAEVDGLNAEIKKDQEEHHDMKMDKEKSFRLFDIVKQLNDKLGLNLENTSLDIHSEGDNLVIHFWESNPKDTTNVEREVNISISPDFQVERKIEDLKTGETKVESK